MKKLTLILAALVLVVPACSPGEELAERIIESQAGVDDIEIDEEEGTIEVQVDDEDGGGSATIGGGEVPDGFPIGVADGGNVTSVFETSDGASVTLEYPVGEYENLVAFYESWIASSGLEVFNKLEVDSPPTTSWALRDGEDDRNISVSDVGTAVIVVVFASDS